MSMRLISPHPDDWDDLPTPLTKGERQVAEFFDAYLPPGWEIYVQPHLNGLQPDFVLLHPEIGVAVYEVKDWNPESSSYYVECDGDEPVLNAHYPGDARAHQLVGKSNPFVRIRDYKNYINGISTAAIRGAPCNKWAGYGRITAGVIFTVGNSSYWNGLGRHFANSKEPTRYYPVIGQDALRSGRISWVFPETANPRLGLMTERIADLLRVWLREPDFVRQQRKGLRLLTDAQRRLIDQPPGSTGKRRIKGPAGSGKSIVLAARAANLAHNGKRVMVVGFNITLSNYLHDLAVRYLRQLSSNRKEFRYAYRRMIFTHFHEWRRWNEEYEESTEFDAILVDEGNDFELPWWHELAGSLKSGGEMMLAFDQTQDIYRRAGAWTEDNMEGAGFSGPWNKLDVSYRCHEALMPMLRYFADTFMPDTEVDLPVPVQLQPELPQFYPLTLRWVQVAENADWASVCVDELDGMWRSLPDDSGFSDIVCLVPEHREGLEFVKRVEEEFNIQVAHVFSDSEDDETRQRESRPLKCAFWGGNGRLKAITVHSFKGWEARHLLVYVDDIEETDSWSNPTLFYVALTRLLRHEGGSILTVVSSCSQLRDFGQRFFDDFVEVSDLPF